MNRVDLEHIIRASAEIADDDEIVVIGNTRGKTGWCLDPHDLVVSETIAGREKDLLFLEGAARHRLVDRDGLLARLEETELDDARRKLTAGRIRSAFRPGRTSEYRCRGGRR
jgi:hypothetical protein